MKAERKSLRFIDIDPNRIKTFRLNSRPDVVDVSYDKNAVACRNPKIGDAILLIKKSFLNVKSENARITIAIGVASSQPYPLSPHSISVITKRLLARNTRTF